MSTRSVALENIIDIIENGRPLHLVLSESLDRHPDMDKTDRAFVSRLTRGVTERKITLDTVINKLASVKVNKQKPVIRNVLRTGIYQILFMDAVTDFAAVDECVKLTGKRGFRNLQGFVNGVLRNCCRRREEFLADLNDEISLETDNPDKEKNTGDNQSNVNKQKLLKADDLQNVNKQKLLKADDSQNNEPVEQLVYKYSMPEWIVNDWIGRFGVDRTEAAFRYFLNENAISIRVNLSKTSPEKVKQELESAGIKVIDELVDKCFKLEGCGNPEKLKGFEKGEFTVQDFSSCLAGLCAGFKAGERVLDLCAAPGGKSIHAADLGVAEVVACDLSARKTDMIRDAAARCGFENIHVLENDATVFNKEFENAFDVVICDLPCSGLGIIGKKPDIKYNMNPDKMKELAELQQRILDAAVRYVKKGGTIIYSTCTVDVLENEKMVEYLVEKHGFATESINKYLPENLWSDTTENGYLQLLPGEYGCDGFFMARLIYR